MVRAALSIATIIGVLAFSAVAWSGVFAVVKHVAGGF